MSKKVLKEGETNSKLVEYIFNIYCPGGTKFTFEQEHDNQENIKETERDHSLGFSGSAVLMKNETKLSDKWNALVVSNGPSIVGALGIRYGNGFGVCAVMEPSLTKMGGQFGPLLGFGGLNINTGFKISEKGFQFLFLGFGFSCGIDEKFTLDSPFLSVGFTKEKRIFRQITLKQGSSDVTCMENGHSVVN